MLRLDRAPRCFGRTPPAGVIWLTVLVSGSLIMSSRGLLLSFPEPGDELIHAIWVDMRLAAGLAVVGILWSLGRARGWLSVSSGYSVWIIAMGVALRSCTSHLSTIWEGWPAGEQAWGDVASEIVPAARVLGLIAVVLGMFFLLAEAGYARWLTRAGRRGLLEA